MKDIMSGNHFEDINSAMKTGISGISVRKCIHLADEDRNQQRIREKMIHSADEDRSQQEIKTGSTSQPIKKL